MDKLATRLREDARSIDVVVSPELERRIEASLRSVEPEGVRAARRQSARPPFFWLASTLTGVAAAAAVIAIVNWQAAEEPLVQPAPVMATVPPIDLHAEAAVLTSPLQLELENLQSDLKKAEEKVRRDIGL